MPIALHLVSPLPVIINRQGHLVPSRKMRVKKKNGVRHILDFKKRENSDSIEEDNVLLDISDLYL